MDRHEEIERRFMVETIDPDILREPSKLIRQAYCEYPEGLRVRITDFPHGERTAELTNKVGQCNLRRIEENQEITVQTAEFLFRLWPERIKKTRYIRDGWDIDFFEDQLRGLVLAEFEMEHPEQEIVQPKWIGSWIEVTDRVTNRQLARDAAGNITLGTLQNIRDFILEMHPLF